MGMKWICVTIDLPNIRTLELLFGLMFVDIPRRMAAQVRRGMSYAVESRSFCVCFVIESI